MPSESYRIIASLGRIAQVSRGGWDGCRALRRKRQGTYGLAGSLVSEDLFGMYEPHYESVAVF